LADDFRHSIEGCGGVGLAGRLLEGVNSRVHIFATGYTGVLSSAAFWGLGFPYNGF
jgi:hypothetical protein